MSRARTLAGLALTLSLAGVAWEPSGHAQSPDRDVIGVAAEGYARNRQAFEHFTCRFRLTRGDALSREGALKGVFAAPQVTYGLWVQDGSKRRFQLGCDQALIDKALKENPGRPPCPTMDYLTDGTTRIDLRPNLHAANIWPAGRRNTGSELNPFDMSLGNPSDDLHDALNGKGFARFDGADNVDGTDVLTFSTGDTKDRIVLRYWLAPTKGFLPLRTGVGFESAGSEPNSMTYITDPRQYPGDRWFPMRSVNLHKTVPGTPVPFKVLEFYVTELDLSRPSASAFTLVIPEGYQVLDPTSMQWAAFPPGAVTVRLGDLGGLSERFRKMAELQEQEYGKPTTPPNRWSWFLRGVFVAGALLLVAPLLWWRRSHRRA